MKAGPRSFMQDNANLCYSHTYQLSDRGNITADLLFGTPKNLGIYHGEDLWADSPLLILPLRMIYASGFQATSRITESVDS